MSTALNTNHFSSNIQQQAHTDTHTQTRCNDLCDHQLKYESTTERQVLTSVAFVLHCVLREVPLTHKALCLLTLHTPTLMELESSPVTLGTYNLLLKSRPRG